MELEVNLLRFRVMQLLFDEQPHSVTQIARTLGEQKYTISRLVGRLEQQGAVRRTADRRVQISAEGKAQTARQTERFETIWNHLTYEGVDVADARRDASLLTLYASSATLDAIKASQKIYALRQAFDGQTAFSGGALAQKMQTGIYHFPFVIYRETAQNGSNLSVADRGFLKPCTVEISGGAGNVHLQALPMQHKNSDGLLVSGIAKDVRYFDAGAFVQAERNGDLVTFPLGAMRFCAVGTGVSRMLHGSLVLQMTSSAGREQLPPASVIFTMLI